MKRKRTVETEVMSEAIKSAGFSTKDARELAESINLEDHNGNFVDGLLPGDEVTACMFAVKVVEKLGHLRPGPQDEIDEDWDMDFNEALGEAADTFFKEYAFDNYLSDEKRDEIDDPAHLLVTEKIAKWLCRKLAWKNVRQLLAPSMSSTCIEKIIFVSGGAREFSERTSIPLRTAHDWRSGTGSPPEWAINMIAKYLSINIEDLGSSKDLQSEAVSV